MKILLTLDYEVFLGNKTGSVDNCLITPMRLLEKVVSCAGARFTVFVDATYLLRCQQLSTKYPALAKDFSKITQQLRDLKDKGHDLQLHIHPQWAFSDFNGKDWILDDCHYKLRDLDHAQALSLTLQAKELLDNIIGKPTIAFRAGGFSAQPTALLNEIFLATGIIADSSACPGTFYDSPHQAYDYRGCSDKALYRFDADICQEDVNGRFVECPISMYNVLPTFNWKLLINRLVKRKEHATIGDGQAVRTSRRNIFARLTSHQLSPTTIDGLKIDFLNKSYLKSKESGKQMLTVLGHPKLATPYSLSCLEAFCKNALSNNDVFVTISDIVQNV